MYSEKKINRPYALSIAGFDPSAGAGVLADIKVFEANKVYGLGVSTSITFQNENEFAGVEWLTMDSICRQIELVKKNKKIGFAKIGLIENFEILDQIISYLTSCIPNLKIIWDPILKASAGFDFHKKINVQLLENICKRIYLVTPNIPEALLLGNYNDAINNITLLKSYCNVYLKGGHSEENKGRDFLFTTEGKQFSFRAKQKNVFPKHGSGCVLSSAITANLAKGYHLHAACLRAKSYTERFLTSNKTLAGFHKL